MQAKEELKFILTNIKDSLKFHETKHGALVALNAGLVYASVSSYIKIEEYVVKPAILISVFCFGISLFFSFIANFLSTHNIFYKRKKRIKDPNLYYFGHLSCLNRNSFNDELQKIDEGYIPTKLDNDLIDQIIFNSKIAHIKFGFYRFASYLTAFGSALIGGSSLIKIFLYS